MQVSVLCSTIAAQHLIVSMNNLSYLCSLCLVHMHYSKFYGDGNLMDCDSTSGCDGSGCSHIDCSNNNYRSVDLLPHYVQETRYVHDVHATTCLYHAF